MPLRLLQIRHLEAQRRVLSFIISTAKYICTFKYHLVIIIKNVSYKL